MLPAVWSPRGARLSPPIALSGAQCGVRVGGGQNPRDRQSMGDWQFEEIWRPKRQISSNCQSPVVCLSPCRSIREYTPRCPCFQGAPAFKVLPCSRGHMRGLRPVGPKPPFPFCEGAKLGSPSVRPGSPGKPIPFPILSTSNRKNEKNLGFFSFFRFEVLKIDRGAHPALR